MSNAPEPARGEPTAPEPKNQPAGGESERPGAARGLRCAEFVELLTAFRDQTLDADTRSRFADHLPTCDGCRRYLEQCRRVIRTLGALPAESLPDGSRDALLSTFRDTPTTATSPHRGVARL